MIYQVVFTAWSEFMVNVEADSEEEAMQKFHDDDADWKTLINTGNGEPGYVEDPAHDGVIQEIIE
tara:strand:+ start:828 stop:1022 length:195 start_codon:yes stop_codon:yes gene_type:complete